ncbi:MAG: hypothetical protein HDT14_05210 [Oscillibacter sp.]|nr:hypothetical protein [Oscillibacter sp.]
MLALYSLAHFWVDLSCALLVFRTLSGGADFALCLLLYNFCAFALQMPFGLLADRWDRNGAAAALGCALTAAAYLVPAPLPAAVTAGVGNALFHLGGGIDVLNRSQERAWALGVFVSPGALGLYLGTLWGKGDSPGLWIGPVALILLGGAIVWLCRRVFGSLRSGNAALDLAAPHGYGVLLPLFLVVVLRSYMGMNQAFAWKSRWALVLTLALVLGKTAGGFAMDRLGAQKASAGSLGLASALYLASALPLPGTLAVFLFNMTMPVTLWAAARAMPGAKGFTFGLLTFALFLGFLPSWLGWPSLLTGPVSYAVMAAVSLVLLWFPLRKGAVRC